MTALLLRALAVGVLIGVALSRLRATHHLLAWELVLFAVALWEMRALPPGPVFGDRPLFSPSPSLPARLPRAVSSTEWMVMDALTGRVDQERRLRPTLRRIAEHRLHLRGLDFGSAAAPSALGEREWAWLTGEIATVPDPAWLDHVVEKLERL